MGGISKTFGKVLKASQFDPILKIGLQAYPNALISRELGRTINQLEMKELSRLMESNGMPKTSGGILGEVGKTIGGIGKTMGDAGKGIGGVFSPFAQQMLKSNPFLLELQKEEEKILLIAEPGVEKTLGDMERLA